MTPEQQRLYHQLLEFSFDDGTPTLGFADRLAHEQGWDREFTNRVLDEYRKFLVLIVTSGHPCSPSDIVDKAWHHHLTYTRSYWERLCGEVLGRPLHHEPTRGGAEEHDKFAVWYATTLESYAAAFGEPPADIWPRGESEVESPSGSEAYVVPLGFALLGAIGWFGFVFTQPGPFLSLVCLVLGIFGGAAALMCLLDSPARGSGGGGGCGGGCGIGCGAGCGGGCGGCG